MKQKSFVLSAIILALGGFFAKAIGAIYKIPLTNILGSGGIGLYYLIFPIYSLIITFCSSGISVALSTEVAKCRAVRDKYNEQKFLRVALCLSFFVSLVFAIMIILVSRPLAEYQGNVNASMGYIAISPAIIISSLIATIRGYFQGIENMVPTTVSMIIEQVVKLSFGLILAHKMCSLGIQYAVLGAVIGVTISEIIALIIIAINFFSYKAQLHYNYRNLHYKARKFRKGKALLKSKLNLKKNNKLKVIKFKCRSQTKRHTTFEIIKRLMSVLLPATLTSIVLPIATMLDSFMIINLLIESGYSSNISTSLYGLWGGVIQSLISLPIIIVAGVSTSIVPSLSGVVEVDSLRVQKRVAFFIKLTIVLSILMCILIFVFAEDILYFLYGDGLSNQVIDELYYATKMFRISSISIIYYALLQTFTAIFQTLGKSNIPFWSLFFSLVIRVVLIKVFVSMPQVNIFGAILGNTIFLGLTTIILSICLRKCVNLNIQDYKQLLIPSFIGIVCIILMMTIHNGLCLLINYFVSMMISGLIGCIVYIIWVYNCKVFDSKEKSYFLLSKKKLSKKN